MTKTTVAYVLIAILMIVLTAALIRFRQVRTNRLRRLQGRDKHMLK